MSSNPHVYPPSSSPSLPRSSSPPPPPSSSTPTPPPPPPPPSPPSHAHSHAQLSNPSKKAWVDPEALPDADSTTLEYPRAADVGGCAPLRAKRLALNTFAAYGVGGQEAFGHAAGRKVRFVRIDCFCDGCDGRGRERRRSGREEGEREGEGEGTLEVERGGGGGGRGRVTVIAEITVDSSMVNGNGMMHGGCLAYLIDNCASMPLVVLGVLSRFNAVGVTQAINILFHAPAPLGATLEIISTTLALGGRSMSAKCEIFNKTKPPGSGRRLVASAFINKMQPKL